MPTYPSLHFRCSEAERAAWRAAADSEDIPLGAWLRKQIDRGVTGAELERLIELANQAVLLIENSITRLERERALENAAQENE